MKKTHTKEIIIDFQKGIHAITVTKEEYGITAGGCVYLNESKD